METMKTSSVVLCPGLSKHIIMIENSPKAIFKFHIHISNNREPYSLIHVKQNINIR